ncbi:MAG: hypothetical protein K2F90_00175 [Clostridiales bacterium]|nr:hypothetical protein [Clostridiales bacterium]
MCFRKSKKSPPKVLPWDEIVKIMYDKDFRAPDDCEIIDVVYSYDKAHRYLILKSNDGYFRYQYEYLIAYDEDELIYFGDDSPGYWLPHTLSPCPLFNDMTILMRELKAEPDYKTYFEI